MKFLFLLNDCFNSLTAKGSGTHLPLSLSFDDLFNFKEGYNCLMQKIIMLHLLGEMRELTL